MDNLSVTGAQANETPAKKEKTPDVSPEATADARLAEIAAELGGLLDSGAGRDGGWKNRVAVAIGQLDAASGGNR